MPAYKFKNDLGEDVDDLLSVNSTIDSFHNEIVTTKYNVYGLTGKWGVGKTSFIQIWENINKEHIQIIHIDAFKKDYESDPFMLITSAIYHYFKKENASADFKDKAKEYFFSTSKIIGKTAINVLLEKIGSSADIKAGLKELKDQTFETFLNIESEENNPIQKLKKSLVELTTNKSDELYIVIDELDRCRPDFALELLEKIKHIFLVKNIKFILVYNNEVLFRIIEKTYGLNKFDGRKYLSKFIDKEINYPASKYISIWIEQEVNNHINRDNKWLMYSLNLRRKDSNLIKFIFEFEISLREISRMFSRFNAYKDFAGSVCALAIYSVELVRLLDESELNEMIEIVKFRNGFSEEETVSRDWKYLKFYKKLSLNNSDAKYKRREEMYEGFQRIFQNELY